MTKRVAEVISKIDDVFWAFYATGLNPMAVEELVKILTAFENQVKRETFEIVNKRKAKSNGNNNRNMRP